MGRRGGVLDVMHGRSHMIRYRRGGGEGGVREVALKQVHRSWCRKRKLGPATLLKILGCLLIIMGDDFDGFLLFVEKEEEQEATMKVSSRLPTQHAVRDGLCCRRCWGPYI